MTRYSPPNTTNENCLHPSGSGCEYLLPIDNDGAIDKHVEKMSRASESKIYE